LARKVDVAPPNALPVGVGGVVEPEATACLANSFSRVSLFDVHVVGIQQDTHIIGSYIIDKFNRFGGGVN